MIGLLRRAAVTFADLVDGRSTEMRLKEARAQGFGQGLKAGIRIGRNSAEAELLGEPMQDTILRLQVYANSGGES